jgi:HSP20 family molecular chaperone IbpA
MDMSNQPVDRTETAVASDTPAIVPAVDVFENEQGITLRADLPGVSRDNLDVRVEAGQLTIEGRVALAGDKLQPVYAERRRAHYRRVFALSRDLDTARVEAGIKDGVLTLRIPRAEQARPRRIAVSVS